jgi:hypothetical protein
MFVTYYITSMEWFFCVYLNRKCANDGAGMLDENNVWSIV